MWANRLCLWGLGAVVLGLLGCQSNQPVIKPPKLVEEFALPPQDDPRFCDAHYIYPKSVLNQHGPKMDSQLGPPPMMGSGAGMGSGGMRPAGGMGGMPGGAPY